MADLFIDSYSAGIKSEATKVTRYIYNSSQNSIFDIAELSNFIIETNKPRLSIRGKSLMAAIRKI
ncbi:MAG: hypothetical protein L7F77_14100, partial [Candidatus Magnetominusculus sp. LBB02]|nr:hypothetical protein [Candidatus Magnetominusculus sp. LBB02]